MSANNNLHQSDNIGSSNGELVADSAELKAFQSLATLADALNYLLSQQGYAVDNVRLADIINRQDTAAKRKLGQGVDTIGGIIAVLQGLGIEEAPEILKAPDGAFLPLLGYHPNFGWGVIEAQTPQGEWKFAQGPKVINVRGEGLTLTLRLRLTNDRILKKESSFNDLLKSDLSNYKGVVIEAILASFLINFLALAVSLFSMQVYDRVIPTRSEYTLIILASGVALIIIFEAFMKFSRAKIMDKVVVGLDQYLSREVFQRLLRVRIDQMPGSVGSMAAQLRGYEQVRSFFTASTLFGLVDLPMTMIFIALIAFIGSPLVALVPVVAAVIALCMGLLARKRIDEIAAEGASASYYKTGLLVETVEGVETIKAGAGSWKFLSRWLDVMNVTVKNDLDMKHANDNLSYFTQMLQQTSYVGIVILGAFVVMKGDMTMGGLIACSILGGRVLAPVMAIPNLLVQYAHAKAAKKNIEGLFALEQDNHGVSYPLSPTKIRGHYQCDNLVFNYLGNDRPAVTVTKLTIKPGERIAILGPIGSGKSTLLKLLSGLYAPTSGRLLLDGLDIQQISREALSEQVGYLQQDHRLFQGSLRENLLIGMAAPSDDVMHDVMQKTGLINLVANHSSGLDLPISEGGRGLSGGQKQLVAFTRLLLTKPSVLLIDEPTASMDNRQEQRCLQVLRQELQHGQTMVVATHKTALLELVDRIIIMDGQKIVMDGEKEAVLKQLMQNEQSKRSVGINNEATPQPLSNTPVQNNPTGGAGTTIITKPNNTAPNNQANNGSSAPSEAPDSKAAIVESDAAKPEARRSPKKSTKEASKKTKIVIVPSTQKQNSGTSKSAKIASDDMDDDAILGADPYYPAAYTADTIPNEDPKLAQKSTKSMRSRTVSTSVNSKKTVSNGTSEEAGTNKTSYSLNNQSPTPETKKTITVKKSNYSQNKKPSITIKPANAEPVIEKPKKKVSLRWKKGGE